MAVSDKITAERLAEILGLPQPEDFFEGLEVSPEAYNYAYTHALQEGMSEEEAEEFAMEAERDEMDEAMRMYWDGLESAAERLFEEHGLEVDRVMKGRGAKRAWTGEYKIEPIDSWRDAASKIMETVNGVGIFTYYSLKEFLDSGPWTPRQAVLEHLGWIKYYPEVYGSSSAQGIFEGAFR